MKELRVISFSIPYPADYGGVIDIYYRLKALNKAGVAIELHCFQYDRNPAIELESLCSKVYYYPRKKGFLQLFAKDPFIAITRRSDKLFKAISKSTTPLLIEGIHSAAILQQGVNAETPTMIRIHNIEHEYYSHLAAAESNPLKQYYFRKESEKLLQYESVYGKAQLLACISQTETDYYQTVFGKKAFHLPAFHPYEKVNPQKEKGDYVLYHGNLEIAENHKAALFLVDEVASNGRFPLIIAGKNPRTELKNKIVHHSNIKLVANPTTQEMEQLIAAAHVHALPTFQSTGVKLKLLAALFSGRHVVTNPSMLKGTGLQALCHVANAPEDFRETILALMDNPLSTTQLEERKLILEQHYNNDSNALLLMERLGL